MNQDEKHEPLPAQSHVASAWRVTPQDYLDSRPSSGPVPVEARPRSLYLTMRDGVRIAIDVYLPPGVEGGSGRAPTILILTPYYRRFKLLAGAPAGVESAPNAAQYRDMFVPRGYALVVVDVRGTGASFGVREGFRSPLERDDYSEIVEWIVAQPWSDGLVGSTGISYLGAAADFLASTGHPAVKAIAPLFSVWDTYSNHYYPGGILLNRLAVDYDRLMVGLDHDRRDILADYAYFGDPHFDGPHPVDDDPEGEALRNAVVQHRGNFHMPDFIREFSFKGDGLPYDACFTSDSFSPCAYADGVAADVAVYSVSGWMDGGGFSNGAISRFLSLPNSKRHLLLGPWDHGARTHCSPFRADDQPAFPLLGEVLRFFDHYLMGRDTGLDKESAVHYYTIGEETWRESDQWPPRVGSTTLHMGWQRSLAEAPTKSALEVYPVDLSVGTGQSTRYERLAAQVVTNYYSDWHGRDKEMLCFTSAPLAEDFELSGHPLATLEFSADQGDCALHVYLEDVDEAGRSYYVTEGMLRTLHRQASQMPARHQVVGPYRTFTRADARPLAPGETVLIMIALLPVSWCFSSRHRIRLAIAGADADHFMQVPHGRPPTLTVKCGRPDGSRLELPGGAKFCEQGAS